MALSAILLSPREQIGREIGRGLALAVRAWRQRLRIEFRLDRLPVEMPGGVAEHGDDDGKAEGYLEIESIMDRSDWARRKKDQV